MAATANEPLFRLPLPLPPELIAEVARRRADGRPWGAVGAALRLDAGALRGACAADPRFAAALAEADDAAVREAERRALKRLSQLTDADDERVALRASEVLVKYAREWRREAQQTAASGGLKPPEGAAFSPRDARVNGAPPAAPSSPSGGLRPPLAEANAKPVGAFRAVPDLPAAKLDELVKGG